MENRKVKFDSHTNLLQLEEHMYPLVDVKTPNVFHNLFPYEEVPKIAFNDRIVPHHMPDEIWITDTTFRDGQQSRAPYTTEQIVRIYDYMHRLGGPKGKIRQCEFFLYSKKDRDAVYKCLEQGYEFPEITSWIRASKKDFELVRDMGLKETGCQLCRHLGLLHGILCIFNKHLICFLVQCRNGFCLDLLAFQHDRLCQCLLKYRKCDDKCGIDLADQVHVAECHRLDHRDRLHGNVFCGTQILCPLLQHHQCLI